MKPRCIKKPFDTDSWCGQCCVNDVLTLNSDSLFLNLLHNKEADLCSKCLIKIQCLIVEKTMDKFLKDNKIDEA